MYETIIKASNRHLQQRINYLCTEFQQVICYNNKLIYDLVIVLAILYGEILMLKMLFNHYHQYWSLSNRQNMTNLTLINQKNYKLSSTNILQHLWNTDQLALFQFGLFQITCVHNNRNCALKTHWILNIFL